jgi:hypothetical protein
MGGRLFQYVKLRPRLHTGNFGIFNFLCHPKASRWAIDVSHAIEVQLRIATEAGGLPSTPVRAVNLNI